jgi:hypothetical protein
LRNLETGKENSIEIDNLTNEIKKLLWKNNKCF